MSASLQNRRHLVATAGLSLLLAACSVGEYGRQQDGEATQRQEQVTSSHTAGESADIERATGTDDEAETPGDEAAAVEPGTRLLLQGGMERKWPNPVDTLTAENPEAGELALLGVHRLDEDRVVVTARLKLEEWPDRAGWWTEPGYFQGGTRGWEFSAVSLTTDGGDITYLPVRDEEGWCLCSTLNTAFDAGIDTPVWTVVTAPSQADEVDVRIEGFGTVAHLPVTELPTEQPVPLGWGEVLQVRSAERTDGQVRVRLAIGNPTVENSRMLDRYRFTREWHTGGCFQGLAAWGSQAPVGHGAEDPDCTRGGMPEPDEQVELAVLVGDPGTEEIVLLPTAGLPVSGIPVDGEAEQGERPEVYPYQSRTESHGASVSEGESVTLSLDTAVLFEYGEADLTAKADATLAEAVRALQGQDGRAIIVAGHTDSQGDDGFNMQLSRGRAGAVAQALKDELDGDWAIEVEWHGESQLAIPEKGSEQEVEAAQARNRRVEITVD